MKVEIIKTRAGWRVRLDDALDGTVHASRPDAIKAAAAAWPYETLDAIEGLGGLEDTPRPVDDPAAPGEEPEPYNEGADT